MRVYKYPLTEGEMLLPEGARPLHVAVHNGVRMMWVLVNHEAPLERRYFYVVATGQEVPTMKRYFCTFLDGSIVLHVFERVERGEA